MRIAILGSNGQIGRALADEFIGHELFLFSRNSNGLDYYNFNEYFYDLIINCIGTGKPNEINRLGWELYKIDEEYDRMVIDYLHDHPKTLYVYLSSGAVHGTDKIYYTMLKRTAECRHRNLPQFNIVDIRIYSFVSKYIDLHSKFFIAEVFRCIKEGDIFKTNYADLVRDYVDASDLAQLILKLPPVNAYYEAYSDKYVHKQEILEYYKENYGLKIEIDEVQTSANNYFIPIDFDAQSLGYVPQRTSFESIIKAGEALL